MPLKRKETTCEESKHEHINLLFALGYLAFFPEMEAVLAPPDGGYNTAEGQNALLSLTTGGFNPSLVAFNKKRHPLQLRYGQVNAMLRNEFLKEHKKVQQLEAKLA